MELDPHFCPEEIMSREVSAVEPITLVLFPTLSPSLIGHPASVDVKQHKSLLDGGYQARSKDQGILEEGGGAGPSLAQKRS